MRHLMIAIWLLPACAACAQVQMTDHSRTVLQTCLDAEQIAAIETTLDAVGQESLGPMAAHGVEIELPERTVTADATLAERGSGILGDPWVGAIEANLADLDPPATLLLPEGHYQVAGLEVPSGVVLKAEMGGVVLIARPEFGADAQGRIPLISLASESGLVGVEIDGGSSRRAIAAYVAEGSGATISDCHIHDMRDGMGVYGPGTGATVVGNLIETIGYSGIRNGSNWTIAHNTIRFAGIDRPDGGGGDDGIIPNTRTTGSRILNNLVIAQKRPNGRHAIATQVSHENLFAGNLCVCLGLLRGGIVLADDSDRNVLTGNVVVGVPDPATGERANMGIHLNGDENVVRGNAVIGTNLGVSVNPGRTGNVIEANYLQVAGSPIELRGRMPGDEPQNTVGANTIVGIGAGIDYANADSVTAWGREVLHQHDLPEIEAPAMSGETVGFDPVELRGEHVLAIGCEARREVAITLGHRQLGSYQSGLVWGVYASDRTPILSGNSEVGESATITFTPETDGACYLVGSAGRSAWLVESANAPVGIVADRGISLIHGPNRFRVQVAAGAEKYEVTLSASEREPARLTVLDPDGREVATGQTLEAPNSAVTLEVPVAGHGGEAWTLETSPADEGRFEDHRLTPGEGLAPVLWLTPAL